MRYYLTKNAVLKWIETPSVYHIIKDDLYELDDKAFEFLRNCTSSNGCNSKNHDFVKYCLREDILTKNKIISRYPPIVKSPVPSLRYLELQITDKCNLRCRHCYIATDKTKKLNSGKAFNELSVNRISKILKEFEQMQGLRVLITGGEPLVHSEFREINEMLPELFVRKILFTNGILLDKKILKKLNVNEIQISIDGLEKAHNALRGQGTFKMAMQAAKAAISSGFDVSIATMIHPLNLNDFDEMERLLKNMGVKEWAVDVPCVTGRLNKNPDFQIEPETGGKYFRFGYGGGLHEGAPGFACGLHLMSVMADGRVSKCSFYADNPVGRIEDGLRNCWNKIKPVRLEDLKCDCKYIESCRGGCRYRATLLGDPFGRDLYKCSYYGKML